MVKYYAETKTDFVEYIIMWGNVHFMLLSGNNRLLNPCTLYDTCTLKMCTQTLVHIGKIKHLQDKHQNIHNFYFWW